MIEFNKFITRADDECLQNLIGTSTLKLLKLIDPALANPRKLLDLLLQMRSPYDMLTNPESRQQLLDLLRPEEAIEICRQLGIQPSYESLRTFKPHKNSNSEASLLSFFGVLQPSQPKKSTNSGTLLHCDYPLFEHQRRAVAEVNGVLCSPPHRVLLHMPTGAGKTRTAMNIICDHLRKEEPDLVVWLAYSEELCTQAYEEFCRAWASVGNRKIQTQKFWGENNSDLSELRDGVVFAGLSKMYQRTKKSIEFIATLADRTGLVVIDEAHQAVAESYSLILDVLSTKRLNTKLLGLSATPGRTWNDIDKDEKLADFFGRKKVTLKVQGHSNPVEYLIREGYLARPEFTSLPYASSRGELTEAELKSIAQGFDIPPSAVRRLAEDEQRNLVIVNEIERLSRRHRRILLFAATVSHSEVIAAVLNARGIFARSVTAKTDKLERDRIIQEFRADTKGTMVLANFGVLTTGFDAPKTSAALIARPTRSLVLYSQMVGRATRGPLAGGNEQSEIRTIVDTRLPGFGDLGQAFLNWEDVWQ